MLPVTWTAFALAVISGALLFMSNPPGYFHNAFFFRKMVLMAKRVEMLVDPRLLKLKRSSYWKPLVAEVRKGYSLYPDTKGAFFLDSMYFEDQKYRTYSLYSLNGLIEEIDTVVLPEFKFTEQQAIQKDSFNYLALQ